MLSEFAVPRKVVEIVAISSHLSESVWKSCPEFHACNRWSALFGLSRLGGAPPAAERRMAGAEGARIPGEGFYGFAQHLSAQGMPSQPVALHTKTKSQL